MNVRQLRQWIKAQKDKRIDGVRFNITSVKTRTVAQSMPPAPLSPAAEESDPVSASRPYCYTCAKSVKPTVYKRCPTCSTLLWEALAKRHHEYEHKTRTVSYNQKRLLEKRPFEERELEDLKRGKRTKAGTGKTLFNARTGGNRPQRRRRASR